MPYKKNPFDPLSREPFKLSRSKIDLFTECQRCFYLEQRLGISRPSIPSFTLNNAVDHLLKREFDSHRALGEPHPLMKKYAIPAVPFEHPMMDEWRANFTGVRFLHKETNLLVFGAVDDLWKNTETGELHVVDYKATSKDEEVKELQDTRWHNQYRRQMEVYQWLLRKNGFPVSSTGYFVYVNGRRDAKAFDAKLEFDVNVISYKGNDAWVSEILPKIKECLVSPEIPKSGQFCEYCQYREQSAKAFKNSVEANFKEKNVKTKASSKVKKDSREEETRHSTEKLF